jgi:cobalt-zinc-cadmium efflux system membrane fusion protein
MQPHLILFAICILIACRRQDNHNHNHNHEVVNKETKLSADKIDEDTLILTPAQFKTANIKTDSLQIRNMSQVIRATGILDLPPQQLINISLPMNGILKHTDLLEGMYVKKHQPIATIEHPDFIQLQQEYLETKARFELAKTEYIRQQELAKEQINAEKTLQQAQSEYAIYQARLAGLKAKLKLINIDLANLESGNITGEIKLYAPANGYVTKVNVNIGKSITPTDVLFQLANTEHLHAELTVFDRDASKLKIGQIVNIFIIDELTPRKATIHLIGKEIDKEKMVRVHCHFEKEVTHLLPGMSLKAQIEIESQPVHTLLTQAIVDHNDKSYVFMQLTNSPHYQQKNTGVYKFKAIEVITGSISGDRTAITFKNPSSELFQQQYVVQGVYYLLAKLKNTAEENDVGHAH